MACLLLVRHGKDGPKASLAVGAEIAEAGGRPACAKCEEDGAKFSTEGSTSTRAEHEPLRGQLNDSSERDTSDVREDGVAVFSCGEPTDTLGKRET